MVAHEPCDQMAIELKTGVTHRATPGSIGLQGLKPYVSN